MTAENFQNEINFRGESDEWSRTMSAGILGAHRKKARKRNIALSVAAAALVATGGLILSINTPALQEIASLITGMPTAEELLSSSSEWLAFGDTRFERYMELIGE